MLNEDYGWVRILAQTIDEEARIREERRRRAQFERNLAGTIGKKLWEEVFSHLDNAVTIFNGAISEHTEPVVLSRDSATQYTLGSAGQTVTLNLTLNPEGTSFVEYEPGQQDGQRTRLEFSVRDEDWVVFAPNGRRATDGQFLDAAEVARLLMTLLCTKVRAQTSADLK